MSNLNILNYIAKRAEERGIKTEFSDGALKLYFDSVKSARGTLEIKRGFLYTVMFDDIFSVKHKEIPVKTKISGLKKSDLSEAIDEHLSKIDQIVLAFEEGDEPQFNIDRDTGLDLEEAFEIIYKAGYEIIKE
jgi:hypothetical protein